MMTSIFNNLCIQLPAWIRAGSTGNDKKANQFRNDQVFVLKFNELLEMALKRYKIEGLPDTCNERVVLMSLLWYANVVFWDNNGSILALPGTPGADVTLYGDAGKGYIWGANGFNQPVKFLIPNGENVGEVRKTVGGITLPKSYDAVMVKENMLMYPFVNQTFFYADAIADTLRTLDTTRLNIKNPFILAVDEKLKPSVEKLFKERNNNNTFIVGTGEMSKPADKIQMLPFETSPQALRDCTMLVEWYQNQYNQLCSIKSSSAPVDKKAQVSVEELHNNDGVVEAHEDSTLDYLNSQLDIANNAFGLNMKAVPVHQENNAQLQDDTDNNFDGGSENEGSKN